MMPKLLIWVELMGVPRRSEIIVSVSRIMARAVRCINKIKEKEENQVREQAVGKSGKGMNYGYERRVPLAFGQALERVREALQGEGFGVLCEIDIRAKMKEKLGVELGNYVILGACNPPIAYQALQEEMGLGLLLPCNVVVYEDDRGTVLAAIDAEKMLSVVGNPKLDPAAAIVNEKLRRAIDSCDAEFRRQVDGESAGASRANPSDDNRQQGR